MDYRLECAARRRAGGVVHRGGVQHDGGVDGGRATLRPLEPLPVAVHGRSLLAADRGANDAQRQLCAGPPHQEGSGT